MRAFDRVIDSVLAHEGGYSNDSVDPGGETNFGISKRQYPDVNIKNLTVEKAKKIYYNDYWLKSKSDKLPSRLCGIYFDMCVNFGMRGACRVIQQAVNGKKSDTLVEDGRIGPKTIKACKNLEPDRLRAYRVLRFSKIVLKSRKMEKYWFGWFRRAIV